MTGTPTAWTVVVPLKRLHEAKGRLRADGADADRLALAFAADTLAAVAATPVVVAIVAVTSDPVLADVARASGARIVPDPQGGLDAAVRAGVESATTQAVAALTGDLPALTPDALGAALTLASAHPLAVVPDRDGTGTTLLTAVGRVLDPAFGVGSRAAHEARGHVVLDVAATSVLRLDVDTAADLADALRVGVGPATHAACAAASA